MQAFSIKYTGHEKDARKLLLRKRLNTVEELAVMSTADVEEAINANFIAYDCGEDWLLVEKSKVEEFRRLATWVER